MFQEAQIATKYTNHSLRVTGAARMFTAGVPEPIMQRTGHQSLKNLRVYETRGSEDVHTTAVSNILAGTSSTFKREYDRIKREKDDSEDNFDHADDAFVDAIASDSMIPL